MTASMELVTLDDSQSDGILGSLLVIGGLMGLARIAMGWL